MIDNQMRKDGKKIEYLAASPRKVGYKINMENDLQITNHSMIGKMVTVTVDRPLGSYHPKHKDIYYPINYGYIEGIMTPDGEEQGAGCLYIRCGQSGESV